MLRLGIYFTTNDKVSVLIPLEMYRYLTTSERDSLRKAGYKECRWPIVYPEWFESIARKNFYTVLCAGY